MDVQLGNLMCTICKKGFSNGKALGGHMRIHARDSSNGNAGELDFEALSNLISGGGTPFCSVCSREFDSWKLLYEHMRSHPEREWLGIIAPHRRGRREVSPDVIEPAMILAEIRQKSSVVVGDSGEESELNNVVVGGLGSDPEKRKSGDPNGDPGLGLGRVKCATCERELASRRVLGRHWLKHTREICDGSRVSDTGSVTGSGSTREVGVTEQSREEGRPMEPDRSHQQPRVGPTLGKGGPSETNQIGETRLAIDLNFPAEPEDD